MRLTRLAVCLACAAALVAAASAAQPAPPQGAAQAPKPRPQRPTPDDLKKIEAALPDKAPAAPQKARKLLVFTKATGFVHSSIPVGAKAFEMMGAKTGAYTTVVSDDVEMFAPEKLSQFDAILMLSTTGALFVPKGGRENLLYDPKAELSPEMKHAKELRESFLNFVRSGKGVMGIHAATDASYQWKEYGEMMGGYFNGHPWGKITLFLDDPSNPVNAAFEGKPQTFSDEIYTFKDPYSRERLHVLASIDLEASGIDSKFNRPKDQDYAVSWLNRYGQGRVFYSLLGHREETYFNAMALKHFLAGLQYAMGDLPADDKPSGALPAERLQKNLAVAAAGWKDVCGNEKWYKELKAKEQTFTGTLEAVPNAGGPGILMRTAFYKLGDRTVFTGGKKIAALDDLVGKSVDIKGKANDMELEGKNLKEIWPAMVRQARDKK